MKKADPDFSRGFLWVLFALNAFTFLASWGLGIFFIYYKEYVVGGCMLLIMLFSLRNLVSFYRKIRLKGRP